MIALFENKSNVIFPIQHSEPFGQRPDTERPGTSSGTRPRGISTNSVHTNGFSMKFECVAIPMIVNQWRDSGHLYRSTGHRKGVRTFRPGRLFVQHGPKDPSLVREESIERPPSPPGKGLWTGRGLLRTAGFPSVGSIRSELALGRSGQGEYFCSGVAKLLLVLARSKLPIFRIYSGFHDDKQVKG